MDWLPRRCSAVIVGLLTGCALGLPACACAADEATRKPNILWIVGEDVGPDLGCYGNREVATPNLDRLAAQGCRYSRVFSTAPVCSAARSALMTGAYQTAFGAGNHRSNRQPGAPALPARVKLLTERFREVGYFTANVVRFPTGAKVAGKGKTDWNFSCAGRPFDSADWQDLKSHQPFFAQVNLEEAHRIYHRPEKNPLDPAKVSLPPYLADDPLIREDWAAYLNAIQTLDTQVGEILKLVEQENMAGNTIVMFMGDNGREDFRGKYHLYEQGTSVPLIVRAPSLLRPGSVSDALVSGVDLAATVLSLADIHLPAELDGLPFMGPQRASREYVFTALDRIDDNFDRVRAVRDARWKYLRNFEPNRPYLQADRYRATTNPTYLVMRKLYAEGQLNADQRKFMATSRPTEELYDLEMDPYELNNLATSPEHAKTLARMRGVLQNWMHITGDDRNLPESRASLEFSRQQFEASWPRNRANNLKKLRAEFKNFWEIDSLLPAQ